MESSASVHSVERAVGRPSTCANATVAILVALASLVRCSVVHFSRPRCLYDFARVWTEQSIARRTMPGATCQQPTTRLMPTRFAPTAAAATRRLAPVNVLLSSIVTATVARPVRALHVAIDVHARVLIESCLLRSSPLRQCSYLRKLQQSGVLLVEHSDRKFDHRWGWRPRWSVLERVGGR